jgi:lysophospholipase L1-like esterase
MNAGFFRGGRESCDMSKKGSRAKVALIGIGLGLVPLLLLVFEAGTRMVRPRLDPLAVFVTSPQLRIDTQGENTSGIFEFDPLLTWRIRPDLRDVWWDFTSVTTNSRGARMNREVSAKRPGTMRIVALGDSVTFGYRVPLSMDRANPTVVDEGRAYPAILEESLIATHSQTTEVIPLACPGYSSGQGLAWLRREIADLKPDIVTACFGWNDIRAAGLPDRETFPQTEGQARARSWISKSQGLLYMTKEAGERNSRVPSKRAPEPRSSPEEYTSHFEQMSELCRTHGAWFGIILPVYRDPNTPETDPGRHTDVSEGERMTAYRKRLREVAKSKSIPALEIPELTEAAWPATSALFGERIHPNSAGHRLMADRIATFLEPILRER